jgi:hypothetical protein
MISTTTARLVAAPAAAAARPCSTCHDYQWRTQADLGMNLSFMDDITASKRHARRLGKRTT